MSRRESLSLMALAVILSSCSPVPQATPGTTPQWDVPPREAVTPTELLPTATRIETEIPDQASQTQVALEATWAAYDTEVALLPAEGAAPVPKRLLAACATDTTGPAATHAARGALWMTETSQVTSLPGPGREVMWNGVPGGAMSSDPTSADLPQGYAASFDEAKDLLCVMRELTLVQQCSYLPFGTLDRYQVDTRLRLIDLEAGIVMAEALFRGGDPPECPQSKSFTDLSPSEESYGQRLSWAEIITWAQDQWSP